MFIYIIMGTVFFSIFLLILSFGMPVVVKRNHKSSISQLSYYTTTAKRGKEEIPSFFERIILPVFTKIASLIKRVSPKGIVESNKHKLALAGSTETFSVDVYLAIKFLFPVGFLFLSILLAIFFQLSLVVRIILLALIPLSYFLPDIFLRSKIKSRQLEIRKSLPNALDLLSISVEAGMGFDIALARVANNIKGPLGEEFKRMLHDIQLGFSRKDAFRNLNNRTDVPELSSFIVAMTQAEVFGISISKVLKVQASEMRTRRRQLAEETGIKAPVKLVFPLILCIFPSLLTVILGPAVIRVYYTILEMIKR
jgi:tight adherence protein C